MAARTHNPSPPRPGHLPPLPVLRNRRDLAEALPTVVVDTREQDPLPIARLPTVAGTLTSGDYALAGAEERLAIERKSIADLVSCVGPERDRFERELHRLRGHDFARLLIVGTETEIREHRYRSRTKPKSVLHSLYAWEIRFRVPFVFAPTPEAGAALVERWTWFYCREIIEGTNETLRHLAGIAGTVA